MNPKERLNKLLEDKKKVLEKEAEKLEKKTSKWYNFFTYLTDSFKLLKLYNEQRYLNEVSMAICDVKIEYLKELLDYNRKLTASLNEHLDTLVKLEATEREKVILQMIVDK